MNKVQALLRDILQSFRQYYGMLFVAIVATIAFILEIDSNVDADFLGVSEFYIKLGCIALCGISLMFALHIAQQRYQLKWPLPILGILILLGYYFWLPKGDFDQAQNMILLGVSAVSFHLLVAVIPFWKPQEDEGFWDYNKHLFIQTLQTGIFTVVLWAGLALALLAIEHLFNIRIPDEVWGYTAACVLILGSSLVFALFAKDGFHALRTASPYPQVLKFFVQYILIPLLILYLCILYSYGIKILLEWDLPKGWVSYLVLAYSFLGILSLLLLHPLREVADRIWVRFFFKIFYITLLPLLLLLFVAIGVRIQAYGFTENRYYVLLLACWLLGISGFQLIKRQAYIWVIPVSLFVIGYGSLWIPGLNVWKVSYTSQNNRLEALLEQNQLLNAAGHLDFDHPIKRSELNMISDKVRYLSSRNQIHSIQARIDSKQTAQVDSIILDKHYRIQKNFESLFTQVTEDLYQSYSYTQIQAGPDRDNPVHQVSTYDYFIGVSTMDYYRKFVLDSDSTTLYLGLDPVRDSAEFEVHHRREVFLKVPTLDTVYRFNYQNYLDSIYQQYKNQIFTTNVIRVGDLHVDFSLGTYQARIAFEQITFQANQVDSNQDSISTIISGAILLRK